MGLSSEWAEMEAFYDFWVFEISIPGFTTFPCLHGQLSGYDPQLARWDVDQRWLSNEFEGIYHANIWAVQWTHPYLFILYKPRVVTLWQDLTLSHLTSNDNDIQHKRQPWILVAGICTRQSCLSSFSSCAGVQPSVQTGEWWFGELFYCSVRQHETTVRNAFDFRAFCSCGQGSLCAGRMLRCLQQFRIKGR